MEPLTKYLLMLYPHEDLQKSIQKLSRQFISDYPNSRRGGKPGISLVSFRQKTLFFFSPRRLKGSKELKE